MRFAANLNMLFTEVESLVERYAAAKAAGFRAVECSLPYSVDAQALAQARQQSQLEHVLINTYPGMQILYHTSYFVGIIIIRSNMKCGTYMRSIVLK